MTDEELDELMDFDTLEKNFNAAEAARQAAEARAAQLAGVVARELALFDLVPAGSGIALSSDAVAGFVADCRAALTASPTASAADVLRAAEEWRDAWHKFYHYEMKVNQTEERHECWSDLMAAERAIIKSVDALRAARQERKE